MFVSMTTTEGKTLAINPHAIAAIIEREPEVTAIETADGNGYTIAESFLDVKVKLESAINMSRNQHKN